MTEPTPPPSDADKPASLYGTEPRLETLQEVTEAVEAAFDYRGDVTLHLSDGEVLEGYIFDRRRDVSEPTMRLMLKAGGRRSVPYSQVRRLLFSGRDTAAGKSWETWVKKYHEKKARGESANLLPDPLDDERSTPPGSSPRSDRPAG